MLEQKIIQVRLASSMLLGSASSLARAMEIFFRALAASSSMNGWIEWGTWQTAVSCRPLITLYYK